MDLRHAGDRRAAPAPDPRHGARRELSAGEIAAGFDVSRPAISQHLTILRGAGVLSERREGTRRLYRARPEGMAGLRES